ncbi:MAG: adenylyltransferase/cytidyltransferase family protein [Acidobacteriota bacterium]
MKKINKYYEPGKLKTLLDNEKKKGKKIALANGGFDLIHIGHIRYLKAAKKIADILVVALNSDRSLKKLKGEKRAVIDEKGRVKIISALDFVDFVTVFDQLRVDDVLLTLKPDFHCKGSDYTPETVPERETVLSYGGKIKIVGGRKIRSTSDIIKNVKVNEVRKQ